MTTVAHLNSAISHLDELAANSTNLDKKLTRSQWLAIKEARRLVESVVIEVEDK